MKHVVLFLSMALVIGLLSGCAPDRYHKEALPDPQGFNAHFGDMDLDGNDLVNWTEFKDQFPQGDENVFKAVDLNGDDYIYHEEWHKFKEAHGLTHE